MENSLALSNPKEERTYGNEPTEKPNEVVHEEKHEMKQDNYQTSTTNKIPWETGVNIDDIRTANNTQLTKRSATMPQSQPEDKSISGVLILNSAESVLSKSQEFNNQISSSELEEWVKDKITKFRNNYNFAMSYSLGLYNILKYFNTLLLERISNSINENKSFLKFFSNISSFYKDFSDQILKSNMFFKKDATKFPKIFDDNFNSIIENTQISLSSNFLALAVSWKNKIVTKEQWEQIESIYSKMEGQQKKVKDLLGKIEKRRKKLEKLFKGKYEQIFDKIYPIKDNWVSSINITNTKGLEEAHDFVLIDLDFGNYINKLFVKTSWFLSEMKDTLYSINWLLVEYTSFIKQAVTIYIDENKKIFNSNLTAGFDEIQKYLAIASQPGADQNFKVNKIFILEKDNTQMNTYLREYRHWLQSSTIDWDTEILKSNDKFLIESYTSVEIFFEWWLTINPKPQGLGYKELIVEKFEVSRNPGVFSSWKDCLFIFTKQNKIWTFDKPMSYETFVNSFEINKCSLKLVGDIKSPHKFNLVVNKKGKSMNASGTNDFNAKNDQTLQEITKLFNMRNEEISKLIS